MNLNSKIKNIPTNPGCYLYKNKTGKIIYVGKAKNLKKRVNSYFQKKDHDPKTERLIKEIHDIEYFVTDNEVEALLLESKLIHENKPKYNIDLKDSVRYAYLKITDEKFPRLLTVRNINSKGKFFGPYTDGSSRAQIAHMAIKLFKIRTCTRLQKKECLQYHIGNCFAPCVSYISEDDYGKNIKEAILFLKGDIKKLITNLQKRMKESASKQEYEQAKIFRDQLKSLKILTERQKVDLLKKVDQDVIDFIVDNNSFILQIFHIKKGTIKNKEEFKFLYNNFDKKESIKILTDFVKQYYSINDIPHEIIVRQKLLEQGLIQKYLEKISTRNVLLTLPRSGIKKELLEMVKTNLLLSLDPDNQALAGLQDKLNLEKIPQKIECFDISNIGSTNMVGSMVSFRDGKPDKSNYRKFNIKSKDTQDDFAAMAEIIERRYVGLINQAREGLTSKLDVEPLRADAVFPDLIVIDGGLGQLHSAQEILQKIGLYIPIIGLAKKQENIYTLGTSKPIKLSKKSASLKLLQQIRNETHRFAVSFHRVRRAKEFLG